MPRCRTVKRELVGWLDGELSENWRERVSNHVARCGACAREADELAATMKQQGGAIRQLLRVDQLDEESLLARLRRAVAAEPVSPRPRFLQKLRVWPVPLYRPALLAAAATIVVVLGGVRVLGGPEDVLVPLGIKPPPPRISRAPALFKNYPVIKRLELLENFDTVEAEPLFEGEEPRQG